MLLLAATLPGCAARRRREAIARGRALYQEHCAACHRTDNVHTELGPGLSGLFHRQALGVNGKDMSEVNVREVIRKGAAQRMPAFPKLSGREMDDLLTYLKTL